MLAISTGMDIHLIEKCTYMDYIIRDLFVCLNLLWQIYFLCLWAGSLLWRASMFKGGKQMPSKCHLHKPCPFMGFITWHSGEHWWCLCKCVKENKAFHLSAWGWQVLDCCDERRRSEEVMHLKDNTNLLVSSSHLIFITQFLSTGN